MHYVHSYGCGEAPCLLHWFITMASDFIRTLFVNERNKKFLTWLVYNEEKRNTIFKFSVCCTFWYITWHHLSIFQFNFPSLTITSTYITYSCHLCQLNELNNVFEFLNYCLMKKKRLHFAILLSKYLNISFNEKNMIMIRDIILILAANVNPNFY